VIVAALWTPEFVPYTVGQNFLFRGDLCGGPEIWFLWPLGRFFPYVDPPVVPPGFISFRLDGRTRRSFPSGGSTQGVQPRMGLLLSVCSPLLGPCLLLFPDPSPLTAGNSGSTMWANLVPPDGWIPLGPATSVLPRLFHLFSAPAPSLSSVRSVRLSS